MTLAVALDAPRRPVLRWHGGKWLLAPWIIGHFPRHRVYVEPYGGGASVLLRKERSYAEVYNDLDAIAVNLFRVLRDPVSAAELKRRLDLTPFARDEFNLSYEASDDPVETARRTVVRSLMGFGSDATTGIYRTGFRANSNRSGTTPAHDWRNYPEALPSVVERLRGVIIENRAATDVMSAHDCPEALHYIDPPYVHDTRSRRTNRRGVGVSVYNHELTDAQHRELLAFLQSLQGMVVLSGYPSELYDRALRSWRRLERPALADGARPRTEVLWINAPAAAALDNERGTRGLFDAEAAE